MNKWKSQQSSFPSNITHTILASQITGKSINHTQQVHHFYYHFLIPELPSSIFRNLDKRYSGIPQLVLDLELASIQKDSHQVKSFNNQIIQ